MYLELQEHSDRANQTKVNEALLELSREYGYSLVATNDVHYPRFEDAEAQDLLACIGDGRALEDPDRPTKIEGNYSLRSAEEMAELFAYCPQALSATRQIAETIDLKIPYGQVLIPVFELDSDTKTGYERYESRRPTDAKRLDTEEWNLRNICMRGLSKRYAITLTDEEIDSFIDKKPVSESEKKLQDMSADELKARALCGYTDEKIRILNMKTEHERGIVDRLEYELTVVELMGFNGYFNIVSDFIGYAKNNEIPV